MSPVDPTNTEQQSPSRQPAAGALYEVFVRSERGLDYVHCGNVRATGHEMALQRARTLYARRGEAAGMWLVPSAAIITSPADEAEAWFGPHTHHACRDADFYRVPDGLKGL